MIDSHCHLDHEPMYSDLENVINRSKNTGVEKILSICTTNDSFKKIIKIVNFDPIIYGTYGIHPHECSKNIVTKDEIKDINNLKMMLDVNGERMQTGNTSTMIFNVDIIVSYVSKFMSLQPGDIITTGTPPGVGMGRKPQVFLKAGDQMKLSIENLGEQNSKVVAV